jgi:hypothetical protein
MPCNNCENTFQSYQSIVVSIVQSGSSRLFYVQNRGQNIVMIRRILLCYTTDYGAVLYPQRGRHQYYRSPGRVHRN